MKIYPINQLYEFTPEIGPGSLRPNPLGRVGALNEAEFIDMRLSPQRSRAGILCDIKWCSDFKGSNTALVVLLGVGNVSWSNDEHSRQLPWHARYVTWEPGTAIRGNLPPPPLITDDDKEMWALDASRSPEQAAVVGPPSASEEAKNGELPEYILKLGRLSLSGLSAALYIGHVDGMDGAPPDMTELSDAEIIAGFPQWSSVMEVQEYYTYPDRVDCA